MRDKRTPTDVCGEAIDKEVAREMKVIYPVSVQAFPICGTSVRLVLSFLSE